MSRFLYFYLMRDARDAIRAVVPAHVDYWQSRQLEDYLGGPFTDRSGGLITFAAENLEHAQQTVQHDPFVQQQLIARSWVKEWVTE